MSEVSSFKVLFVGDAKVGKTSYISRYHGVCVKKYYPTIGAEIHPITFYTDKGPIILEVWDIAGDDHFSGIREKYYEDTKVAIIMTDKGNQFLKWYDDIKSVVHIPVVHFCDPSMDPFLFASKLL